MVLCSLICSNNLLIRVEFPKQWSLANICPLYKKGDRALPSNYRPVSLTRVPCKMLEHIVCTNIMAHLHEHRLLSDRQQACRKTQSCETQLITVTNDWAKSLDAGGQVDTFILDFKKIFNTPPQELLKYKLQGYGINGKTLVEIDSFLCSRQQRVVVNGAKLQWASVLSVSAIVRLTALKTHRHSKSILINWANGLENGVWDFSLWNVLWCNLRGSGSKRSMQFTP